MTPREFMIEARAFARTISARADISLYASTGYFDPGPDGKPIKASLYLHRKVNSFNSEFSVEAETFDDLMAAVKAKWIEHEAVSRERVIRDMALAIIEITAMMGQCTDSALRVKFEAEDVARYGDDAAADANTIADKGPFRVVRLGKANNQDGES